MSPNNEPTRVPTDLDVAWIAGLYEGEGSCWACSRGTRLTVGIYQKDPEVLMRCREMFGGWITQNRHRTPDKVCNVWNLGGDNARMFLQVIYPFMSARRKVQIDKTSFRKFTGSLKVTRGHLSAEKSASLAVLDASERLREYRRMADEKRSESRKAMYWYKKVFLPEQQTSKSLMN